MSLAEKKRKRILSNPGRNYEPSSGAWGGLASAYLDGKPVFTWFDVPRMLRDPQVQFGLRMLRAPFQSFKWQVKAEHPRVQRFVDQTLKKLWQQLTPMLLHHYFSWGYAAGAVSFMEKGRWLAVEKCNVFQSTDVKPRVWTEGRYKGEFAAIEVSSVGQPAELVGKPHAIWFAGLQEHGKFYDRPRLAGAFEPWLESNGRNGAKASRRLWSRKCAFDSGMIRHPMGDVNVGTDDAPNMIPAMDLAREILDAHESGSGLTLPSTLNANGTGFAWEWTPPASRNDSAGVLEYPEQLDKEILRGLGIPPEVIEASEVGSGWSGRSIPMMAYLGSADEIATALLMAKVEHVVRPLAIENFGSRGGDFEVVAIPLAQVLMPDQVNPSPKGGQDQGQPPPASPFQQQPEPQGNVDGQRKGDLVLKDSRWHRVENLSQLAAPATPTVPDHYAKALAIAMCEALMDDDEDAYESLAELANDPEGLKEALGEEGQNLSWVNAGESRSGKQRWRNTETGGYRYQKSMPGSKAARKETAKAMLAQEHLEKIKTGKATGEELQQFADNLAALTKSQLKQVRDGLGANFGSQSAYRDNMVLRLRAYVKDPDNFREATPEEVANAEARNQGKPRSQPVKPKALRANGTPEKPNVADVYTVSPKALKTDPKRFQYKVSNIGSDGVSDELKGTSTWNHELGGTLLVWRDPADQQDYVINGHHRHELAGRAGADSINVRYIDAGSAKEARAKGALANIAEGRGTATDAAKYLRDSGQDIAHLKRAGISMSGKVASDASQLADLSDKAFQRLTNGLLDEQKAVAVAKHLKEPELQDALFKKLEKREEDGKDWSNKEIETAAKKLARAGKVTQTESTLFGDLENEESTFDQEVEIETHIGRELQKMANDYAAVSNAGRADRVKDAGNTLAVDENQKRRKAAESLVEDFARETQYKSDVGEAIKASAAKLAKAKTKKEKENAKREALETVRGILDKQAGGKPAQADAGRSGTGGSLDERGTAKPKWNSARITERLKSSPEHQSLQQDYDAASEPFYQQAQQELGAANLDEAKEKIRQMAQKYVDSMASYVRVKPGTLPKILDSGRFKTQFEAKRSGGIYDPKKRLEAEQKVLGIDPGTDAAERPVYGYLAPPDFASSSADSSLKPYGNVVLKLKDHTRDRSTVTLGDSLDAHERSLFAASPLNQISHRSVNRQQVGQLAKKPQIDHGDTSNWDYSEVQVWGGLSADEIDEVGFPKKPSKAVRDRLEKLGIKWRVYQ